MADPFPIGPAQCGTTTTGGSSDETTAGHKQLNDLETFCSACIEALSQTVHYTAVKKHGRLRDVATSSTTCRFCHFICKAFEDDIAGKTAREREHISFSPVEIMTTSCVVGEGSLVESAWLSIRVGHWKDALTLSRHYTVVANRFRGLNRAIWCQNYPVKFETRKHTVQNWLETCRKDHSKCRSVSESSIELAARVLEVRFTQGEFCIRLVPTHNLDLRSTPYVVLSHCWGNVKIESMTTKDNVNQYHERIAVSSLPKTFQEAVEITNGIEIRYLWIDSLCIIQDDEGDWNQEAAKMAAIYSNATMTISASSAANAFMGCGLSTVFPPATQFTTGGSNIIALRDSTSGTFEKDVKNILIHSPMNTRAWILQEKILSRRMLHATTSLFVWQCATVIETEDGLRHDTRATHGPWNVLDGHVPAHILDPSPTSYNIRLRWWNWVKQYMRRELKHPEKDHYAAFAGITNHYRSLTHDEPVLGLWKKDLHIHLSWEMFDEQKHVWTRSAKPRVASWTWITYPHGSIRPIYFQDLDLFNSVQSTSDSKMRYEAQVRVVEIAWSCGELVSEPTCGVLAVWGLYKCMVLSTKFVGRRYRVWPDAGQFVLDEKEREFDTIALFAYIEEGQLTTLVQIGTDVLDWCTDGLSYCLVQVRRTIYLEPCERSH